MRCNEFDAHIDEMLSGVLHPDANQHMQQCERCTSHYRARAAVQNGLRQLALAPASGPSRATDRAVMESYRRLQQGRAAASPALALAGVEHGARRFTFPGRTPAATLVPRTWWGGAVAAAAIFAVLGSAVHLWNGRPTVSAPTAVTVPVGQQGAAVPPQHSVAANWSSQYSSPRPAQRTLPATAPSSNAARSEAALTASSTAPSRRPRLAATASPVRPANALNYDSVAVTQQPGNAASVLRLASTGVVSNVAESASSTWPGYSNLMYCDPVVCSGPMQVVHIKVPVGQVKPNLGQTVGNSFVNAEIVVGPDGVARAIRVAN